jgi:hypothetical protein
MVTWLSEVAFPGDEPAFVHVKRGPRGSSATEAFLSKRLVPYLSVKPGEVSGFNCAASNSQPVILATVKFR